MSDYSDEPSTLPMADRITELLLADLDAGPSADAVILRYLKSLHRPTDPHPQCRVVRQLLLLCAGSAEDELLGVRITHTTPLDKIARGVWRYLTRLLRGPDDVLRHLTYVLPTLALAVEDPRFAAAWSRPQGLLVLRLSYARATTEPPSVERLDCMQCCLAVYATAVDHIGGRHGLAPSAVVAMATQLLRPHVVEEATSAAVQVLRACRAACVKNHPIVHQATINAHATMRTAVLVRDDELVRACVPWLVACLTNPRMKTRFSAHPIHRLHGPGYIPVSYYDPTRCQEDPLHTACIVLHQYQVGGYDLGHAARAALAAAWDLARRVHATRLPVD
jgi:hypothetical protein